jgi:hypothetical protein
MKNLLQNNFFKLLTISSFSMGLFNTINSRRLFSLQEKLNKAQIKYDELKDEIIKTIN